MEGVVGEGGIKQFLSFQNGFVSFAFSKGKEDTVRYKSQVGVLTQISALSIALTSS